MFDFVTIQLRDTTGCPLQNNRFSTRLSFVTSVDKPDGQSFKMVGLVTYEIRALQAESCILVVQEYEMQTDCLF